MSGHAVNLDVDGIIKAGPLVAAPRWKTLCWVFVAIGVLSLAYGWAAMPHEVVWGAYYTNLVFWMGLALGGVMTSVIFQIVRAKWSVSIRRLGESTVAFLPVAYVLWALTWFGKETLFPWARAPMPGREWWMQPNFVYGRFAVFFLLLFGIFTLFVRWSLRGDVGYCKERAAGDARWNTGACQSLISNWAGTAKEVFSIQPRMSVIAPVVVFLYAVIYSLFAFEMIMGMDTIWFSNMFGGFLFVGNIYIAWAGLAMLSIVMAYKHPQLGKSITTMQLWDNGKLIFGFSMLWGYMFFSQFLPQWYGNLPEETQWLIVRSREMPWQGLAYVTFACAFIIPFIVLLSEDVKRTPKALFTVACVVWIGVWLEKYMLIMPQLHPSSIPLGLLELGVTVGFFGLFALCVTRFLERYPLAIVSSPLAVGSNRW
jgi:hypothetical protein